MTVQWALLGALLGALWPGLGPLGAVARLGGVVVAVACAGGGWVLLARALSRHERPGLGPADHVTVTRGTLACVVAALTTSSLLGVSLLGPSVHGAPFAQAPASLVRTPLVVLAGVALALDAVDGWVARRTRTASSLGARLDMEVDAFLILVLSIAAAQLLGGWVLAIGLFRYLLVVATWVAPWLGASVPASCWRKAVAAVQGIVLTIAGADLLPRPVLTGTVVAALVLLAWSFGTQVAELWQARVPRPVGSARAGRVGLAAGPVVDDGPVQRVGVSP